MSQGRYKIVFALVATAAALTGCESSYDKSLKPALVDDLVSAAIEQCDMQGSSQYAYTSRLRAALMQAYSKDLQTLRDNSVAVCLDARLAQQNRSFLESKAIGLFYREAGVLTIRDNPHPANFISYDVTDFSEGIVHKVADKMRDRETSSVMIAYRASCGKSCTTTKIKDATDFGTYRKTPSIQTAPLRRR